MNTDQMKPEPMTKDQLEYIKKEIKKTYLYLISHTGFDPKVVKILKEYGYRVQKSVFECSRISEEQFLKMKQRIEESIDHIDDTVRYYFICRQCLSKMEFSGTGEAPNNLEYKVV